MNILIGCEYSGRVRDAFTAKGHHAVSCDWLPSESPGNHYQGNVWDIYYEPWDLMFFFPTCTYMCNSGVRWLSDKDGRIYDRDRYANTVAAALFAENLLTLHPTCRRIGFENPVMHHWAMDLIGIRPTQTFQPWQFGHKEIKRTCLWLKGLPPLRPTNVVGPRPKDVPYREWAKVHYASPGPDRWKERSRTYQGVADAMADQWG